MSTYLDSLNVSFFEAFPFILYDNTRRRLIAIERNNEGAKSLVRLWKAVITKKFCGRPSLIHFESLQVKFSRLKLDFTRAMNENAMLSAP